ncbi:MAG: DUF3180 domain-containing protein [Sciscionella sp.]
MRVEATSARELLVAGIVAGVLVHLGLQLAYSSIPELPTAAGGTLLVLAVIELLLAISLRPRLQRRAGTRPVPSLTAVRVVALAKASSMLGAIMLGTWLALLVYVLPRQAAVSAAADDATTGIVGAVCAAALIGAALWLEYCCRNPDEPDDPNDPDDPEESESEHHRTY